MELTRISGFNMPSALQSFGGRAGRRGKLTRRDFLYAVIIAELVEKLLSHSLIPNRCLQIQFPSDIEIALRNHEWKKCLQSQGVGSSPW